MYFIFSVQHWLSKGCPKEKLIVGIPTYGRSWTLSSSNTSPGSSASGAGSAGALSGEAGFLMYNEICLNIKNQGWTAVSDSSSKRGPYAYNVNQWVGYDDPAMARVKAQYILDKDLGGGMFWDLPSDDFRNVCGEGTYPIIRTVHSVLSTGTNCVSSTASEIYTFITELQNTVNLSPSQVQLQSSQALEQLLQHQQQQHHHQEHCVRIQMVSTPTPLIVRSTISALMELLMNIPVRQVCSGTRASTSVTGLPMFHVHDQYQIHKTENIITEPSLYYL